MLMKVLLILCVLLTTLLLALVAYLPSLVMFGRTISIANASLGWLLVMVLSMIILYLLLSITKKVSGKKVLDWHLSARDWFLVIKAIILYLVASFLLPLILFYLFGKEYNQHQTIHDIIQGASAPVLYYRCIQIHLYTPLVEELIFRGFALRAMMKLGVPDYLALLSTSLLFGLLHEIWPISTFVVAGLIYGYLYLKTGKIAVPILAHAGCNLMATLFQLLLVV